jgi:hypothetical protein
VVRKKFHGDCVAEGFQLQLEIAEFCWKSVDLDGSLIVLSENVMGYVNTVEHEEAFFFNIIMVRNM